jgi:proline iminopeptidase
MERRKFLGTAIMCGMAATNGIAWPEEALKSTPGATPLNEQPVKSGGERFVPVRGGKHRVWTKRVGDSPIKVLTLHGGPGMSHLYFECFEDFLPAAGIEFYFYDQLGCLFSDNPDDKSLWTVEGYTEEVEEVRKALGLEDFYLYGHSWGGILAYEYALKYGEHLKGLVISSMVASMSGYEAYAAKLRAGFPPEVQKMLARYEAKGDYDAPEYQQILNEQLYARYICRLNQWPAPVELTLRFVNASIYNYLQGPNEFVITGTLKSWDRRADLGKIKTRALVMGARYDEMDPDEMRRVATLMPNARAAISDRGSHLAMYDDQEWYFRELIRFLRSDVLPGKHSKATPPGGSDNRL